MTGALIEELTHHHDYMVRWSLVMNPAVGLAVAEPPTTEWNTLARMVDSRSTRIVPAIANHPKTPPYHPLNR